MPGIIWIAVIGLLAGIIARFLLPGPNNPQGFLVTMVIGIVGLSSRRSSAKALDGIGMIRAQD